MTTKNTLIYFMLFLTGSNLMAQHIGYSGGLIISRFYDFYEIKNSNHESIKYDYDFGYSIGISYEHIKKSSKPIKLQLRLINYKGDIFNESYGMRHVSGSEIDVEVNKYCAVLGIYPYYIMILEQLRINIGWEFSFLILDKTTGSEHNWSAFKGTILRDDEMDILSFFNAGLCCQISYDIRLNENWFIAPQYAFHLGLTNELKNATPVTKSMRHYIEIGLVKQLK